MSMIQSDLLLGQEGGTGYTISRSLRFNSSDSAKCARTYSTGSSTTTQTLSLWVKRAKLGTAGCFWSGYDGSANYGAYFEFTSGDALQVYVGGSTDYRVVTTQVFRDTSAWYHLVLNIDTNNSTSSERIRLYVNGSRVTTFSTANYPTSGYACQFAMGNANNTIGTTWGSSAYSFFDGYLADVHFIDGQALTPSSFTEVSATTGQLIPKQYTGSFGTNGFWLKFSDNSAATATTLGKDYSGNSNNWTPNNLSVTAGAGNDSLTDTPTSYGTDTGAGGEVRGNYCTLNPLINASYNTYSNGNLECAFPGATTGATAVGTLAVSSGKWYWELNRNDISAGLLAGIARIDTNTLNLIGSNATSYAYKDSNGNKINNGTSTAYGATWNNTNIIGVALDLDAGTLVFYKDGVSQGTAFSGLSGTFYPAFSEDNAGSGSGVATNFGQRPFAYTAPSGFKALCDTNLPAPVVAKPNTVMDVKLYTGNGSTQSLALSFSPDFLWFKARSDSGQHALYDIIRGASKSLVSNSTAAEATEGGGLSTFDSAGFSLSGDNTVQGSTNGSGRSYVAWCWDAGSSTVTNTQGSITSQVRANASAGFSIVTYTGNGTNPGATIGHGLGVAPGLIITKSRSGAGEWPSYHSALPVSNTVYLNATYASTTYVNRFSAISSTTFTTGSSGSELNANGVTYVAYCFAPVAGYSAMGSYVGNGSSDGVFQWCGFRPRWIMIKSSTLADGWQLFDTARGSYNVIRELLEANNSGAENTALDEIDVLSNGFKQRNTRNALNASGQTYVWVAFAESPFAYSRAR